MHEFFVKLRALRGKRLIADNVYLTALAECFAPTTMFATRRAIVQEVFSLCEEYTQLHGH